MIFRRFPIISGLRVSWDSRRQPGQRVLGVWLLQEAPSTSSEGSGSGTPALVNGEFIKREKNGRKYKIVTREYLASGHDGYTALLGREYLIDDEHGQLMSSLVRTYLLGEYWDAGRSDAHFTLVLAGAHYINKMVRLREKKHETNHLHSEAAQKWQRALHKLRSRAHYRDHFNVTAREHMSGVDCYDGKKVRQGSGGSGENGREKTYKEDLLVIHPVVDGRCKDVARS